MGAIELTLAGVDAELAEQRLHAEGTGFIGDDRYYMFAEIGVFQEEREHADEGHGAGDFAAGRAFQRFGEQL